MKLPWARWLIRLGVGVSFALIGWFIWQHAGELRTVDWRAMAGPVSLSLLFYGVALGIQGTVWIRLFALLTGTSWNWEDVKTYYTTHLMRRLPGAPWHMAGRAFIYRERSPEAAHTALAVSLIEWAGTILSGLVWVAGGLWGLAGIVLSLGALASGMPLLRRWTWPARWVSLKRFSLRSIYLTLLAYEGQWLLAALILYLLLRTLSPAYVPGLLETGVFWAISGIISSLAVFAPAGLGIRELSLVALLEPHVGLGYAALGALLMRVIFTLGDTLWGLVATLIALWTTPRTNTP